jgi:hypothetical protein
LASLEDAQDVRLGRLVVRDGRGIGAMINLRHRVAQGFLRDESSVNSLFPAGWRS